MTSSRLDKMNITTINHDELVKIIKRVYEVKQSLFVQGGIGIGKSFCARTAAKEIAKELHMEFVETKDPNRYPDKFALLDIRLAQKDAGEILGLPENYAVIKRKDKNDKPVIDMVPTKALDIFMKLNNTCEVHDIEYVTRWTSPSWFPRGGYGIMFLDEFNLAPPLVQYNMYELINDRALGDYYLPEGWVTLAAGNRGVEDGAPVFDFASPLNNRFMWYELEIPTIGGITSNKPNWTKWAIENKLDVRVIGFLQTKTSALYNFKPNNREKAFPTPRSWHRVSNIIKGVTDEELVELYAAGLVGTYTAGEFRAFLQAKRKLPPTEKYINDPKGTKLPETDDLLYVLCINLMEYFLSVKDQKEGIEAMRSIVIFSERLWKETKKMEFAVFLLKLVKIADVKYFTNNVIQLDEFDNISGDIKKYLL